MPHNRIVRTQMGGKWRANGSKVAPFCASIYVLLVVAVFFFVLINAAGSGDTRLAALCERKAGKNDENFWFVTLASMSKIIEIA
jgi:hypothetical protein